MENEILEVLLRMEDLMKLGIAFLFGMWLLSIVNSFRNGK